MHPLDGPRLKLTVALDEIDSLQQEIERLKDLQSRTFVIDFHEQSRKYILKGKIAQPPKPIWGVRIGEIAHNLRSSLDGLVWQLSLLNTPTPFDRSAFPISYYQLSHGRRSSRSIWFQEQCRGCIKDISPKHQAMIEQFQPYKKGNGNSRSPLALLHALNNADKHRNIQVTLLFIKGVGFNISRMINTGIISQTFTRTRPLQDGTKLHELSFAPRRDPSKNIEVNVEFEIATEIAFTRGCECDLLAGTPVAPTLTKMADVVKRILNSFSEQF